MTLTDRGKGKLSKNHVKAIGHHIMNEIECMFGALGFFGEKNRVTGYAGARLGGVQTQWHLGFSGT